jgi:hypothetical protein
MLAEMAGIPRMAAGKAVVGQFDKAIAGAVAKFKQLYGKSPSAQEMEALKSHVQGLSNPSSPVLRSGMSAQPRAAYELATDPNLINPDTARDEFLTKMTTGRTTKGTNLRPMAQDINDPSVVKNIEGQQMAGQLDEAIPGASQVGSTTPSADYFGEVSTNIENAALQGGAFDKLKQGFFEKFGRYPDADETNALIAEFNPSRHQYGPKGVGVVGERPGTAKGMTEYRNQARNEGVPETYLTKRPGNYPQYLQDELELQKGILPAKGMKEAKRRVSKDIQPTDFYIDDEGNLVKVFPTMKAEGGQITPDEMLHQMIVQGQTPQMFARGGRPGIEELDKWTVSQKDPYDMAPKMQAYEPGIRERATDAIAPYLEKIGMTPRRAREQAGVVTGDMGSMDPQSITAKTGIGPTMFIDPLAPLEAIEQFKRGDVLGGGLSASILPAQAMAIKPLRKMGSNKSKKSK